jgi:hypothetical protein
MPVDGLEPTLDPFRVFCKAATVDPRMEPRSILVFVEASMIDGDHALVVFPLADECRHFVVVIGTRSTL